MSHGGFGGHGHGGHAVHHGHHSGHHSFGLGGQVIDASLCLDLLQGVFVSLFPSLKSHPWFKKKQYDPLDPEASSQALEHSDWEDALKPVSLKERLLRMDLRPFLLLGIFIGGLCLYSLLIYWLRHNDDPTGRTFNKFKTKDALLSNDGRGGMGQQPPAGVGELPQPSGFSLPQGGYAQPPQQPLPAQVAARCSPSAGGYIQVAAPNGYAPVQPGAAYNQLPATTGSWASQGGYANLPQNVSQNVLQNVYGSAVPQQALPGQAGNGWQSYDPRYRAAGGFPSQSAYQPQVPMYASGLQPGVYGGMQGAAPPVRHRVVVTR